MAFNKQSLTAAGQVVVRPCDYAGNQDNVAIVEISGTFVTAVATFQSTEDPTSGSSLFANVQGIRLDTGAVENTPTLTNATTRKWKCPIDGMSQFQVNLSSLGSGTFTVAVTTSFVPGGIGLINSTQAVSTVANTVTSTSANALAVGASGTTNPVLNVDASTTSVATGVNVKGAAAGSGVAVQALTSGTNEVLLIDAAAAALVKIGTVASTALGLQVGSSTSAAGTALVVQSTSTGALVVGRLGATTPAFQVDANTATSITGVKVKSAAAGGGVAISAVGEASNGALKIDAQGTGVLALGDTSTGGVGLNRGLLQALQVGMTLTGLGTTQSSTPTSAQLLGGIITQTGATGAGTITLPTGTALSTACPRTPATGDTFECSFVNVGGGFTLTVTGATGTTVVGGATIASAKSAKLVFTCTGSNAWSIYTIGG